MPNLIFHNLGTNNDPFLNYASKNKVVDDCYDRFVCIDDRRYDLDWIRVFCIFVLFFFHTAMIFVLWPFHIKNSDLDPYLSMMNVFLGIWNMPILFFVAGSAAWFSLTYRNIRTFITERIYRLLIPLIFGIFLLIPPQVYFERLQQGLWNKSFFSFYPTFFQGFYPEGNFSWNHLWVIAYLFFISLLVLPITRIIDSRKSSRWICRLSTFANRPGGIFLFALPLALSEAILRPYFPQGIKDIIHDWANVSFYSMCYLYGYIMVSDVRFGTAINRHRRIALILGTLFTIIICYYSIARTHLSSYAYTFFFHFLCGFNIWFWMIVLLAYVRESFSFSNKFLRYFNHAVLPFFMIHQTIIIVIGYYIVSLDASVSSKFWSILILSFFIVWLLYEVLVRRFFIFRFIFGLKKDGTKINRGEDK
ncbi:glucan biosynthesis protein [Candidatus Magnetomorum sp. HK-1]|nr:glucan biosynthesis protein [Candidatus Magnetomorum sp. HK-1]